MSIQFKLKHILFMSFTLIASIPVVILAYWVQQVALENEVSTVKEKHLLLAKNVTRDLTRYVSDVQSSFELVLSNLKFIDKIKNIDSHLKNLDIRYIYITDDFGNIKNKIPKTDSSIKKIHPDIWKLLQNTILEAKKTNLIVFSNLIRTGEEETTFFLIKITENQNIAVAALATNYIKSAQQQISFGKRGHVAIVDRTGRAIAHPVADWVKSMKDMSFLPPVIEMMKGNTGVTIFYTPAMQGDVIAGYTSVKATGWGVMVPQPFEELIERAESTQKNAVIIMLVSILGAGVISWFLSALLVRPIHAVIDATKFSKKDKLKFILPANVAPHSLFVPKETCELVDSFNNMSNRLNTLTTELYSKIDFSNKEVTEQNLKLKEQAKELVVINKELERLSTTDNLTNLFNRRLFDEMMNKEFFFSMRHKEYLSLVIIDIDNFKLINDEYGHVQGDRVLIDIANVIKLSIRTSDVAFRIGGEEFAILCRRTNYEESKVMTEKIRSALEKHIFDFDGNRFTVTGSFGIVTIPNDDFADDLVESLYRYADKAMYYSKDAGRNCVTHYNDIYI